MIKTGAPLTREKWISMAYLGHPPKPWTAEHEEEVPSRSGVVAATRTNQAVAAVALYCQ
jgi:hypothetical protein